MSLDTEISVTVPAYLIDEIAERVADKVVLRLRPYIEHQDVHKKSTSDSHGELPPATFLRLPEVVARIGVARGTI